MGHRLKRLREAAGLSQPELANLSGIKVATIRNWEQDRGTPRFDTATKIARALKVSLDDLAEPPTIKS